MKATGHARHRESQAFKRDFSDPGLFAVVVSMPHLEPQRIRYCIRSEQPTKENKRSSAPPDKCTASCITHAPAMHHHHQERALHRAERREERHAARDLRHGNVAGAIAHSSNASNLRQAERAVSMSAHHGYHHHHHGVGEGLAALAVGAVAGAAIGVGAVAGAAIGGVAAAGAAANTRMVVVPPAPVVVTTVPQAVVVNRQARAATYTPGAMVYTPTPQAAPLMQGWLVKQAVSASPLFKNWKRRWYARARARSPLIVVVDPDLT